MINFEKIINMNIENLVNYLDLLTDKLCSEEMKTKNAILSFYSSENGELKTLYKVLRSLNINDIKLTIKRNNTLIAKDSYNSWKNSEFYEFLINEAFVYDDGSVLGVSDELLENFYEYAKRRGVKQ